MKNKQKLQLEELQLASFVTDIEAEDQQTVEGGYTGPFDASIKTASYFYARSYATYASAKTPVWVTVASAIGSFLSGQAISNYFLTNDPPSTAPQCARRVPPNLSLQGATGIEGNPNCIQHG